ncbi:SLAM family member 5-like isoform X1 [Microcaecilia unicolor]|uniref:SLAM family member 5-like isoform X1 n=1 Tax=Microcaecilia unicolor TaxID=1415580 RepID=A0A6P7X108_9AMPH|nr:SLAM family member 5-like isoform X1 [Microcaecilia unicolor]
MTGWIFLLFFWGAGHSQDTGDPQDVFGILGESVTLPLKIPQGVKVYEIFWRFETVGSIALIKEGNGLDFFHSPFKERLRIHDGKFSLQIQSLREKDGGSYTAEIKTSTAVSNREYKLHVFSRLQNPIIEPYKVTDDSGNITCNVALNCTVKNGEGVNYNWTAENSRLFQEGSFLNVSLDLMETNVTYTCTARNPVSENSTQVRPWSFCIGEHTGSTNDTNPIIAVIIVIFVILVVAAVLAVWIYMKMKRKKKKLEPDIQTVYAQVTKPEGPTETNPILTEGPAPENLNGKTIYSIVNFPKRQNIETEKSLYDTVKLPGSPASVAYDKVM